MNYATQLALFWTVASAARRQIQQELEQLMEEHREELVELATSFVLQEVTPQSTLEFEQQLAEKVREFARQALERVFNLLESETPEISKIQYESETYRPRGKKTNNSKVATLFGTITLRRHAGTRLRVRASRGSGACDVFPLEIALGLVHSATPALAEAACRFAAQAGATQKSVLARLREHYGASIGEERLRNITRDVGEAMERFRQTCQKQRLLNLLAQAYESRGNRKPVLAVGRDGVTLCNHDTRCYENATVGTVTIYDRQGKRLGTVYLAYPPELGQHEMTRQLTALIKAVLSAWTRPLPRLAYVTDAGYQERTYYRATLSKMTHPRTYERLRWIFVVDYYHASLRISKMAEALFGKKDKQAKIRNRWIRRMRRLLKGPRGVFRVLHSAAALYRRRKKKMSVERRETYRTAYQYLRRHSRFMRYSQYKANQIPIGSGVTEAGCKTVFAQRLKLSGMRWKTDGARTILRLRVLLLSGVWNDAFARMLHSRLQSEARTPEQKLQPQAVNAA